MRYARFLALILLSFTSVSAQPAAKKNIKMPVPSVNIADYLAKNIVYPAKAKRDSVEGRVIVKFVVDEFGMVGDVSVVQSLSKECDEEAMRIVASMPPWTPGEQDGRKVKVYFTQPISFRLITLKKNEK